MGIIRFQNNFAVDTLPMGNEVLFGMFGIKVSGNIVYLNCDAECFKG